METNRDNHSAVLEILQSLELEAPLSVFTDNKLKKRRQD